MALSSNLYSSISPTTADDLFTSTLFNYSPELTEQVFEDDVVLNWLRANGNMRLEDGGERIIERLVKEKNSTAAFYSMYENLNVSPVTPLTAAYFELIFSSPIWRN